MAAQAIRRFLTVAARLRSALAYHYARIPCPGRHFLEAHLHVAHSVQQERSELENQGNPRSYFGYLAPLTIHGHLRLKTRHRQEKRPKVKSGHSGVSGRRHARRGAVQFLSWALGIGDCAVRYKVGLYREEERTRVDAGCEPAGTSRMSGPVRLPERVQRLRRIPDCP